MCACWITGQPFERQGQKRQSLRNWNCRTTSPWTPTNDLVDEEDFEDALFGTLTYVASATGNGYTDRLVRAPDGVFMGPKGPVERGLTGALCFKRLEPWRVAQCSTLVIENPWAVRTLGLDGLGLPVSRLSGGRLTTQNGATLWEFLQLWRSWPED